MQASLQSCGQGSSSHGSSRGDDAAKESTVGKISTSELEDQREEVVFSEKGRVWAVWEQLVGPTFPPG